MQVEKFLEHSAERPPEKISWFPKLSRFGRRSRRLPTEKIAKRELSLEGIPAASGECL